MKDAVFGCDLWDGRRDRDGYGRTASGRLAHVEAYVEAHGPVPEGLSLDHTCRRRACRFVPHLEAVTKSEQERRKVWAYRARLKLCPAGHALDTARMVTPEGGVCCRWCARGGQPTNEARTR